MTDDLRAAAEHEPVTADGLRAMGGVVCDDTDPDELTMLRLGEVRWLEVRPRDGMVWLVTINGPHCVKLGRARNLHDVADLHDVLRRIGGGV